MVGLSNVDNTSDLNKPVSIAQQTALTLKANLASPTFTGTVGGITKTMVGLSNVDNTTDLLKPISTATQTALTTITNNVTGLRTDVDGLLAFPNVHSITVGTVTTVNSDIPASISNVGTSTDQVLNFGIPQGLKGDKGDKGDKGNDGSDGANGDSSAATAAAGAAAASAGISAGAATAAASSAASSAGSAAAAAGSAADAASTAEAVAEDIALMQTKLDEVKYDVTQLQTKTQHISADTTNTYITGGLETGNISCNGTFYSAGDITSASSIVSTDGFSGGLVSTKIKGSAINIGTNETLINTVNIGGISTITTINGLVVFTDNNPFSGFSGFFSQF
jgi:hypothetical protein